MPDPSAVVPDPGDEYDSQRTYHDALWPHELAQIEFEDQLRHQEHGPINFED